MYPLLTLNIPPSIKWALAGVVAWWAGLTLAFQLLLGFMAADMLSGILLALKDRTLNSTACGKGLLKKCGIILIALAAHPIEHLLSQFMPMPLELNLEKWIPLGYALTEAISITENIARLGVPLPALLVEALLKGKKFVRMADTGQIRNLTAPRKDTKPE